MEFTWTIVKNNPDITPPIFRTDDPYTLLVSSSVTDVDGIYTVILQNSITYNDQNWEETVSYEINIVNPCVDTELNLNNTVIEDMVYQIGELAITQSFTGISDTISDGVTTSGNCGVIEYSLQSNDTSVGTPYIRIIDLAVSKGIYIYTELEEYIGNFTITMNFWLQEYPEKYDSLTFQVELKELDEPSQVSFAPILLTDVSEATQLEPGQVWSLTLEASDVNDDFYEIYVAANGQPADFIEFIRDDLTM